MNADEIKRLGEALVQNAQFISDLNFVEHEPIEYANPPKSIGVLKSALITHEEEDGYFVPGDNFGNITKLVRASEFQGTVSTDITEWFETFKNLIANYEEFSQNADLDQTSDYRRKIFRHSTALVSNIRGSLKETEGLVNNQFGHVKTLAAKTRETRFYTEKTQGVLNRLSRLDYKTLSNLTGDVDIANIILGLDSRLNQQREYLRTVILKIQKLNLSFRKMERRALYLNKLVDMIESRQFSTDLEDIDLSEYSGSIKTPFEIIGDTKALFRLFMASSYEDSKFKDVALKVRVRSEDRDEPKQDVDCYIDRLDAGEEVVDDFTLKLKELKSNFYTSINEKPLSVIEYWQSNQAANELMVVNVWLHASWDWLKELQQSLATTNDAFSLEISEELIPLSRHSNVLVLHDVSVALWTKAQA